MGGRADARRAIPEHQEQQHRRIPRSEQGNDHLPAAIQEWRGHLSVQQGADQLGTISGSRVRLRTSITTANDFAAEPSRGMSLWVISGHRLKPTPCPLYPQRRTLIERVGMSALCQ